MQVSKGFRHTGTFCCCSTLSRSINLTAMLAASQHPCTLAPPSACPPFRSPCLHPCLLCFPLALHFLAPFLQPSSPLQSLPLFQPSLLACTFPNRLNLPFFIQPSHSTSNSNIQECLVHFVANHEMHTTDPSLSMRALTLLQKVASYHPHTLFLPADDGGWMAA